MGTILSLCTDYVFFCACRVKRPHVWIIGPAFTLCFPQKFYLLVRLWGRRASALNYPLPLEAAYALRKEPDSVRKAKLA